MGFRFVRFYTGFYRNFIKSLDFILVLITKVIKMNTSGGAGNVRGILSELQTNVARKKNDIAALDNKIQERQTSLNQLIQPKLQKLAEEKEEKERQITELESLLVSKEKCRLELMDEHASALHSLKSMGESLEAMEEKIQDKKVEGVENSRFWIEKSRKDAELMMKLKMSGGENQDIFEKVHSSFEEKEKILEELKLRLKKSQDLAVSMEAKYREIEFAMADKSLNEIEQSLAREQIRSMDLDEKDERFAIRQRLAIRKE